MLFEFCYTFYFKILYILFHLVFFINIGYFIYYTFSLFYLIFILIHFNILLFIFTFLFYIFILFDYCLFKKYIIEKK